MPQDRNGGLTRRLGRVAASKLAADEQPAVVEYEYVLHVNALDALARSLRKDDVRVPPDFDLVSFKSGRLVDLRKYKEGGAVSSYAIIKTEKREDVVEEWTEDDADPAGP